MAMHSISFNNYLLACNTSMGVVYKTMHCQEHWSWKVGMATNAIIFHGLYRPSGRALDLVGHTRYPPSHVRYAGARKQTEP